MYKKEITEETIKQIQDTYKNKNIEKNKYYVFVDEKTHTYKVEGLLRAACRARKLNIGNACKVINKNTCCGRYKIWRLTKDEFLEWKKKWIKKQELEMKLEEYRQQLLSEY